ncbi:MAG: hypothetical protein NXI32_07640 [bacterium]|nr:hypothetical protein [bacterium]
MMKNSHRSLRRLSPLGILAAVLGSLLLSPHQLPAQSAAKTGAAAELLPETCVAFVVVEDLSAIADLVINHPLRQELQQIPAFEQLMRSNQMTQFRAGLALFEAGMGARWPKVLRQLTSGGVFAAIDGETDAFAILIRAETPEALQQFRDTVFSAVRGGKLPGSEADPIKTGEYRGITAYGIGEDLKLAPLGSWLLVTNKSDLGKKIVDLYVDAQSGDLDPSLFHSLADSSAFRQAMRSRPESNQVWGYFDIQAIRDSGAGAELYSGRTDNPLAEILFGGIVANLKETPLACFGLSLNQNAVHLTARTPHQQAWIEADRSYYFGADGRAAAPPLLQANKRLFAMSAYRDMSEMWLRSADLMTENAVEKLAQADTQLTTFFSGKDFGEDILAALGPAVQLVAVEQDFTAMLPKPAIHLPAFALRLEMKTPQQTAPEFRRVFQSFIGFLNVVGAMNGQPQFDLSEERSEEFAMVSARYVAEKGEEAAEDAPINFNFSPSLVFGKRHMILSSTQALGRELALQVASSASPQTNAVSSSAIPAADPADTSAQADAPNTIANLDASVLQTVLNDNREQLIAQNMLEKGHAREAAEGEIGLLLAIIGFFEQAQLRLDAAEDFLELKLQLNVRD